MTNKQHIQKYELLEKQKKFNEEVNPIDWNDCYPVTKDFDYVPKSPWKKICNAIKRGLFISPYAKKITKGERKTIVKGKENLKGIKSAIITCNHVYIYDCLVLKHSLKPHKLKYCVAEFNNRKGFLGDMMRAEGILPLSKQFEVLKNFSNAVEHYLLYDNYVVFYPEQSMWYMYDKPRPLKNGAFHYATKFDVPIIPTFITFRNSGKFDKEGLEIKYFTLHILQPIYPKKNLTKKQNIEYLKNKNYEMWKNVYEQTYEKKLKYASEK